jgi:hypothetical protein
MCVVKEWLIDLGPENACIKRKAQTLSYVSSAVRLMCPRTPHFKVPKIIMARATSWGIVSSIQTLSRCKDVSMSFQFFVQRRRTFIKLSDS